MKRLATLAGLFALLAAPGVAMAQTDDHSQHTGAASSGVGTVAFATSCAPAVKDAFNHAVAELHSFWFPEARAGFEGVLKADSACAIKGLEAGLISRRRDHSQPEAEQGGRFDE